MAGAGKACSVTPRPTPTEPRRRQRLRRTASPGDHRGMPVSPAPVSTSSRWRPLLGAALLLATVVGCASRARALDSDEREFDGQRFHVVSIDLTRQSLSLHWRNPDDGQPYGSIDALQQWGARHGKRLLFAANAGIYDH